MIPNDPIVEEVRKVRDAHAARFGYDLWAIFADLQREEHLSGRTFISFAKESSLDQSGRHTKKLTRAGDCK